jgi:hypothetical protein
LNRRRSRQQPAKSIAARTPSPPRILETPNDPFDSTSPDNLFISPHLGKWDRIADGSHSTIGDKEVINWLLRKQRQQSKRDMQDIPGHVERKAVNYAKLYAKERLLERQAEQEQRKAFKMLQDPGNKQKLRRPLDPRSKFRAQGTLFHVRRLDEGLRHMEQGTYPKLERRKRDHQRGQ